MNEATFTLIISIIFGVVALISTFGSYYFQVKEKISKASCNAVDNAEESGADGKEKFEMAVEQLKALVPMPLKPFITDASIRALVQVTFDSIENYAKKQTKKK
jgi:hypothetical protein